MHRTTKADIDTRLALIRSVTGNPSYVVERWGQPTRIQLDRITGSSGHTHVSPCLTPGEWMLWTQAFLTGWDARQKF